MPDYRFRKQSKAAFMCECGASLCDERVRTSPREYDELGGVAPLLADGHGPGNGDGPGACPVCGRPDRRLERRRRR